MNTPHDLPQRMANKITVTTTNCWEWTGAHNSSGYGSMGIGGRSFLTHRIAYELAAGPIPDGLQIDHLCCNKSCCNPAHLEPVTHAENMARSPRATKTHCIHGHRLAGPNLVLKARKSGHIMRNCRTCSYEAARRYRVRNGAVLRYRTAHRDVARLAAAESAAQS